MCLNLAISFLIGKLIISMRIEWKNFIIRYSMFDIQYFKERQFKKSFPIITKLFLYSSHHYSFDVIFLKRKKDDHDWNNSYNRTSHHQFGIFCVFPH